MVSELIPGSREELRGSGADIGFQSIVNRFFSMSVEKQKKAI